MFNIKNKFNEVIYIKNNKYPCIFSKYLVVSKILIIMENKKSVITPKGSLGLLALGDIGLQAWREVKKAEYMKEKNKNEEK